MVPGPLAPDGRAPMPTSGREDRLSPSDWVEPMPNDGDARKPRRGGASAFGGTRPNNSRSISIRFSASRSGDCPSGVLLSVGLTPSSAGWTPPNRGPLNGRAPMAPAPLSPGCANERPEGRINALQRRMDVSEAGLGAGG
jgi:hypothetical protein